MDSSFWGLSYFLNFLHCIDCRFFWIMSLIFCHFGCCFRSIHWINLDSSFSPILSNFMNHCLCSFDWILSSLLGLLCSCSNNLFRSWSSRFNWSIMFWISVSCWWCFCSYLLACMLDSLNCVNCCFLWIMSFIMSHVSCCRSNVFWAWFNSLLMCIFCNFGDSCLWCFQWILSSLPRLLCSCSYNLFRSWFSSFNMSVSLRISDMSRGMIKLRFSYMRLGLSSNIMLDGSISLRSSMNWIQTILFSICRSSMCCRYSGFRIDMLVF